MKKSKAPVTGEKFWGHLRTITKHKCLVTAGCFRVGLYRQGLRLVAALADELQTPRARRDLAVSYTRIAAIQKARGKLNEAMELYRKSLKLRLELAEELGTPRSRRDVSVMEKIRRVCAVHASDPCDQKYHLWSLYAG